MEWDCLTTIKNPSGMLVLSPHSVGASYAPPKLAECTVRALGVTLVPLEAAYAQTLHSRNSQNPDKSG